MDTRPVVGRCYTKSGEDYCAVHEIVFHRVFERKEFGFAGTSQRFVAWEKKLYSVWLEKPLIEGIEYMLRLEKIEMSIFWFKNGPQAGNINLCDIVTDLEMPRKKEG